MLSNRLRVALLALEIVAGATLLRSVAYDRWITVLASALLLVGAAAAHRGKAWGVALAFGQAVAFPVAWVIGIAPPWFVLVGLIGALPFALTARAFARFDRGATAVLTILAAMAGAVGAMAWKEVAWPLFAIVPSLTPSAIAQHGLVVALLAVAGGIALRRRLASLPVAATESHVRISDGARLRVSNADELTPELEPAIADVAPGDIDAPPARRAARS